MTSPARTFLLRGMRAVLPHGVTPDPTAVLVEDGHIGRIDINATLPRGAAVVDAPGGSEPLWILPGWIDLQINDIAWLSRGPAAPAEHARRIREVLAYQALRGVTGLALATLAAPLDDVVAYLDGMRQVLDGAGDLDSVLLGGLVEGTFMNPAFHGAHNPRWVLPPSLEVLERLLATGAVRLLNVAPETSDDALAVVSEAARQGVIVGCGHAKPHAERLRAAVRAGLRYVIHLGNGPTGSNLKGFRDGGMLEESLRNDDLVVTVIGDRVHVHPQLLRDWIARKEVSRVVGISDAGFATGVPSGRFEVFGVLGEACEGGAYLRVVSDGGGASPSPHSSDAATLFGSAAGMRDVFETILNLLTTSMAGVYTRQHPEMPFAEALAATVRLCSTNAARLLGLGDRGEIEPGRRGDLVLARIEGRQGEYRVTVVSTFAGGCDVSRLSARSGA